MTFRRGARLDPTQVRDVRGRTIGGMSMGPIAAGGGGIGLLLLIVVVLLGGGDLLGGGGAVEDRAAAPGQGGTASCQTGDDANTRIDCRVVGFANSIQVFWTNAFAAAGSQYREADTVLFSSQVQTGCGLASARSGPFYCPADGLVYLDLSFFDELEARLGAEGGPLAEGYVIAHEYGHHVQDLLGTLDAQGGTTGTDGSAVAMELQADCFAGVWAANAVDTGFIEPLTQGEIAQALDAAAAVGDDRIQERTTGQVDPDSWTHGSSDQRQGAFASGYRDGDPAICQS